MHTWRVPHILSWRARSPASNAQMKRINDRLKQSGKCLNTLQRTPYRRSSFYCNAFLLGNDVDTSYRHRLWLEGQAARNPWRHAWRRELQACTGTAPSYFCTSQHNCLIDSQRISNQWQIKLVRRLTNVWCISEILASGERNTILTTYNEQEEIGQVKMRMMNHYLPTMWSWPLRVTRVSGSG